MTKDSVLSSPMDISNEVVRELDELLELAIETTPTHALHLCVRVGDSTYTRSIGATSRGKGAVQAQNRDPMRIASVTKTFVAAAILRLWELGRLELDGSLIKFLDAEEIRQLKEHCYQPDLMTIRQLLGHTSGLFDYADTDAFYREIFADPQRHWTRRDQLILALTEGAPYGPPGAVFGYSDTGYNFAGKIIETLTGQSLGVAIRSLLRISDLGLSSTWYDFDESPPEDALPLLHQYDSGMDMLTVHGSFDHYGGGGLISTVEDMSAFMAALFAGQVFAHSHTLQTMLTPVPAIKGGPEHGGRKQEPGSYGLGIDGRSQGKVFLHKGHFGTLAAYVPQLQLAVGLSTGVARTEGGNLLEQIFSRILRIFDMPIQVYAEL